MKVVTIVAAYAVAIAASWAVSAGLMYLVCRLFHWNFNIAVATGIWLIGFIVRGVFLPKN